MSTQNNIPEHNGKADFKVPEGYFDSLTQHIHKRLNLSVAVLKSDEDALLPSVPDNNFEVPANYFNQLESNVVKRASISEGPRKNVIVKKLVGWTVAASVLMTVFFILPKKASTVTPSSFEIALAQTDIAIEEFISVLSNEELEELFFETVNTAGVAELDITDEEETLEENEQKFSEEIKPSLIDEALMNEDISEEDMYEYILDEASDDLFE